MKLVQKKILAVSIKGPEITIIDGIRGSFDTSEEALNKAKTEAAKVCITRTTADVYKMLIKKIKALNGQCVSNAWLKFAEIFKFIEDHLNDPMNDHFNVFMNAELPGAFLCSLNHIMKTQYSGTGFNWISSSFVPLEANKENELQDSYGLLAGNPENWLNALNDPEGYIGDMTSPEQIKMCINKALKRFPDGLNMYTSDAGMDVSSDYSSQEMMNYKLHLGCAIVGLSVLAPKGMLVCKHYTFFKKCSQRILWYYTQFFDRVILIKPVSSRPYNSETYVVCSGYRRPTDYKDLLDTMFQDLDEYSNKEISEEEYLDRFHLFHDIFVGRQIEFLEEKRKIDSEGTKIDHKLYDRITNSWLHHVRVLKVDSKDHLHTSNNL